MGNKESISALFDVIKKVLPNIEKHVKIYGGEKVKKQLFNKLKEALQKDDISKVYEAYKSICNHILTERSSKEIIKQIQDLSIHIQKLYTKKYEENLKERFKRSVTDDDEISLDILDDIDEESKREAKEIVEKIIDGAIGKAFSKTYDNIEPFLVGYVEQEAKKKLRDFNQELMDYKRDFRKRIKRIILEDITKRLIILAAVLIIAVLLASAVLGIHTTSLTELIKNLIQVIKDKERSASEKLIAFVILLSLAFSFGYLIAYMILIPKHKRELLNSYKQFIRFYIKQIVRLKRNLKG